jgi:hypothetical protein
MQEQKQESLHDFEQRLFATVKLPWTLEGLISCLQRIAYLIQDWYKTLQWGRAGPSIQAIVAEDFEGSKQDIVFFINDPRTPFDRYFLDEFLSKQTLIPGLLTQDIYPASKLTLDRLQLYQDVQIFRGKIRSVDEVKLLSEREKTEAVHRLAERIPLKLANREANDALSRMIARGSPFTKMGIRDTLLPSIFTLQINKEFIPARRRVNRTQYLKTTEDKVAIVKPKVYPLLAYWEWLQDRVQADLEAYVLELEFKDVDKETKAAMSPELRGTHQGEVELTDYKKKLDQGKRQKVEIVYGADFDRLARGDRRGRNLAIDEASPDEANFEICSDRGFDEEGNPVESESGKGGDLFDRTNSEAYEFAEDAFENDIGDQLQDLQPALEDLSKEIKVDRLIVLETIKGDLTKRDKQYLKTLSAIMRDDPGAGISNARTRARDRLKLTPVNERQIWSRIRQRSEVKARQKYFDTIGIQGHILLRPDGSEMRVPAWVFGVLRGMNLLLESGGSAQLSPAIYIFLGNDKKIITSNRQICGRRSTPDRYDKDKFPTRADLCGIRPGTITRLVQTLGRDLSGPGEKIVCDCPNCRF